MGRSARTALRAWRTAQQPVCGGRTEWNLHRLEPQLCMPQPETCVCQCRQSIGTGPWGLMSRPRERTAVGYEETVKGVGESSSSTRNAHAERKPVEPQKSGAIAEWCSKGEAAIAAPLPMHQPLPPWTLEKDPARAGSLVLVTAISPTPCPCTPLPLGQAQMLQGSLRHRCP